MKQARIMESVVTITLNSPKSFHGPALGAYNENSPSTYGIPKATIGSRSSSLNVSANWLLRTSTMLLEFYSVPRYCYGSKRDRTARHCYVRQAQDSVPLSIPWSSDYGPERLLFLEV
mmetsp:Transcript_7014/g.14940  ORF Transcript_7014/g.14940 Transcript_7014/m.14940 type:complete len:117 (+) Transcript_7014:1391-1741(+)